VYVYLFISYIELSTNCRSCCCCCCWWCCCCSCNFFSTFFIGRWPLYRLVFKCFAAAFAPLRRSTDAISIMHAQIIKLF